MLDWVLILFFHWTTEYPITTTNIPSFKTEASCIAAGEKAKTIAENSGVTVDFVCVKRDLK